MSVFGRSFCYVFDYNLGSSFRGRGLPQGERSIPLFILPLDEGNSRKVKQLIGGSQGQRVYDSDGLAITQCGGSGCMVEKQVCI